MRDRKARRLVRDLRKAIGAEAGWTRIAGKDYVSIRNLGEEIDFLKGRAEVVSSDLYEKNKLLSAKLNALMDYLGLEIEIVPAREPLIVVSAKQNLAGKKSPKASQGKG